MGREPLSVQDVSGISSSVAGVEVIALLPVVQGVGLRAVGEVIRAEIVSRLGVGHHNQVLDVTLRYAGVNEGKYSREKKTYIKIILVINFLSEKNNSVRFQFHFVSFNFLSILVVTVQYSSGRVAFDTDSQTVPPKQGISVKPVPFSISTQLTFQDSTSV